MDDYNKNLDGIKGIMFRLLYDGNKNIHTYHHDYLRMYSDEFRNSSGSEVENNHNDDALEIFAVGLVKLIDDWGSDVFKYIQNKNDIYYCQLAKEITQEVLNKYNH